MAKQFENFTPAGASVKLDCDVTAQDFFDALVLQQRAKGAGKRYFQMGLALALAFGCIAYACTDLRRTIAGLEHFVRWKYFPILLIGLVIVLAYSRLFGSGYGWKLLLGKKFIYSMKAGVEESSELLGYLFILASAVLANTDKRLN